MPTPSPMQPLGFPLLVTVPMLRPVAACAGTAVLRRRAHDNRASAKGHSLQTGHHHRTFGSVSFTCSEPLCMACFQSFVADQLVPAQGGAAA